jgi:protein O-mannosyl-transferase
VTARNAALAAGLLAAIVAAPSLHNGFVSDDHWVIVERPLLQHPPSIAAVLTEPYWPAGFGGVTWRPAVLASYALDYRLGGGAHWFHAMNVLWAGLATALLTLLACQLCDTRTGLVAGLLFAVHPVHVEAVANVVGRAELMAAAGYAAALLCALRVGRHRAYVVGVALAAAFAIASKEHAVTLPAAIVLVLVARRSPVRDAAFPVIAAVVPIVAYFLLRGAFTAGSFASGGLAVGLEHLNLAQRAWAMIPISLQWWRLLLFPAHLSADYSPGQLVASTGFTAMHLLGILVWAAAGWAAWRWRERLPGLALGIVWLVVTVSPVANVLIPTEVLVAERTLYLPSWGVVVAIAAVGMAVPWPARARGLLLAVVLVLAAARSIARSAVWRDDEAQFQALKRDAPRSYRTMWLVGKDEFAAGHWGSGEELLRGAIALAPHVTGPRVDLARYYGTAGLWRPAGQQLEAAIVVDSTLAPAWAMLPRALLGAGDTTGAVAVAREALRRFPGDSGVARSAGAVLALPRRR